MEEKLTKWADELIHINHLNTLVQRELSAGNYVRASELSERARERASRIFEEVIEAGGRKPANYREPGT